MFLNDSRREYKKYEFDQGMAQTNPFDQFSNWFEFAKKNAVFEANAMHVATVDSENKPKNRVVLLKSFDSSGFIFFSNYNSQKGIEISQNDNVALTFFWPNIERQVRIEGKIKKTSKDISDQYFQTRPRDSQLSAWASNQSQEIESRDALESQLAYYQSKFQDDVPRPDHWGGYIVSPSYFEFWQGRANRYHDRIIYTADNASWQMKRLCP